MSFKKFIVSKVFFKNLGLAILIGSAIILITLIWLSIFTRHGQQKPVPDFYGLTIDEALNLGRKKRMNVEIIDSVYTNLVPRGTVIEQNPYAGFKVKKHRRIVLTINAFNPEMVVMPNLVGLSARQAYALIESSGLEAGNPVYKPDLTIDFVLDQMMNGTKVEVGDSIQKGSEVVLVLGKGLSNRTTLVPDLTGMNLADSKSRILGSSLALGTYNYDESVLNEDDSINAFVYKQNPQFNEESKLQLGSAVYIWLTIDSARLPVDSTLIEIDSLNLQVNLPNQQSQ